MYGFHFLQCKNTVWIRSNQTTHLGKITLLLYKNNLNLNV